MKRHQIGRLAVMLCACPAPLLAQVGPAVQQIATASSVSKDRIGAIANVRELADGRVLVNDVSRRKLLLMDSTLNTIAVVLDSASEFANAYGPQPGTLLPYRADTTFFLDMASYAMLVLDPNARVTRVRAVWRTQDMQYLTQFGSGGNTPGPDARGRMVYRITAQPAPPVVRPPPGVPFIPQQPDSAFVVAANLDTRKLDTLGVLRIPKVERRVRQTVERGFTFDQVINPLPLTDEWAVLPDGTVAFVRGRDYRIEYLHSDGSITSSPKLPFDWQRLTDEQKKAVVDSTRNAQLRTSASQFVMAMIGWVNQYNKSYPKNFKVPEGFVLQSGLPKDWILPPGVSFPANYIYACAPGVDFMTAMSAGSAPGNPSMPACLPAPVSFSTGMVPQPPTPRPVVVVEPSELPDYRPPFGAGSVRADLDGNLWIRTNPMKPVTTGGPIFDIVSSRGELVNRIQLPRGYTIAGFGRGRVVYLTMRDATGIHLARVRLK
jgi:hypothetical protein